MSHCFNRFPIVAYVSLALDQDQATLSKVQEFCRNTSGETDIYAEDILPHEDNRPLYQKVLTLVESGKVSTLIVPSLDHLSGSEAKSTESFLALLKVKGVRLICLEKGNI